MSNNRYLSVFKAPTTASTMKITISTTDQDDEETVACDISDIEITDSTLLIAKKIFRALKSALSTANKLYQGVPVFGNQVAPFVFRPMLTDHIVTLWSQANFMVEMAENNALLNIDSHPTLATLSDFNSHLVSLARPLSLTDIEKASSASAASAELIARIGGNYFAASGYLRAEMGYDTRGMVPPESNILLMDGERVMDPGMVPEQITSALLGSLTSDFDPRTGQVSYPDSSPYGGRTPYDRNRFIRKTYVAGYSSIPAVAKKACAELAATAVIPAEFASIKGGSGAVTFKDSDKVIPRILMMLREYAY